MAQGVPSYDLPGDTPMQQALDATFGQVFHDDEEELEKIPVIAQAIKKVLYATEWHDLRQASSCRFELALAKAVGPDEAPALMQLMCKFLGKPGCPHVPPGEPPPQKRPLFALPLCVPLKMPAKRL